MVNFIIGGIVLILFVLASIKTIKDRKKGGCGCGCSSCSNASCQVHNKNVSAKAETSNTASKY